MCRRGSNIRLAAAIALSAAGSAGAQDAPVEAGPDGAVEAYLEERGLGDLTAVHLRERLSRATDRSRPAIAERLGRLYVAMLDRAATPGERKQVEGWSKALLEQVPEADSFELRLGLAKARYLFAEEVAEKHRLRLATPEEQAEAQGVLRELGAAFQGIGARINLQVERLERQEESGAELDEVSLRDRLSETRRIRSLAMYYAGWSSYYLGLLTAQDQPAAEALKSFGWLLNSPNGRPASVDRVSEGLLHYEHVARAAVGAALCESLRGNDDTALRWLDLLDQAPEVPATIRDQLFARRIVVLGGARRWADLEFYVARRRRAADGGTPGPLQPGEARLLTVYAMEALARPDLRERVRPLVEGLAGTGMGDLVARGEVAQVLDLVDRFGSAQMGTEGFIVNYVRGLRAYESARKAQRDAGESPDEPTSLDAVANEYRAAAALLEAAGNTPDAPSFAAERTNAVLVQGLALFHAGEYEAAARRLEQAHGLAANARQADEALWLAVVALDRAVEDDRPSLAPERDRLTTLYLRSFPAGERAARLVLRRGATGAMGEAEAITILLGVPRDSAVFAPAQRQAARLLYKAFRSAATADRDFAAVRFLTVAESVLHLDREQALGTGPAARDAAASAVAMARQVLDAAMGLSTPDVARAILAMDTLDALALRAGISLDGFADELAYRRFQIATARGQATEASAALAALRGQGGRYADAADRVLYRRALADWTAAPHEPDRARALVEIGRRVLGQFAEGPEALRDPAVAAVADAVARAAQIVWKKDGDPELLRIAESATRRMLDAGHRTRDALRRAAELAEGGGRPDEALNHWRELLATLPQDSSDWYEARYHSLRLLGAVDRARAIETIGQHILLHPHYGPEPWGSRLRELEAMLRAADPMPEGGGPP